MKEQPLETSPEEWVGEDVKFSSSASPAAVSLALAPPAPTIPAAASPAAASPAPASPVPVSPALASPATGSPVAVRMVPDASAISAVATGSVVNSPAGAWAEGPDANTELSDNQYETVSSLNAGPTRRDSSTRGQVTEESCVSETEIEPPSDADVEDNAETDNRCVRIF